MDEIEAALKEAGFVESQNGVLFERVAEFQQEYRHRRAIKTRTLYTAQFITQLHAEDGTVSGFVASNMKPTEYLRHVEVSSLTAA